MNNGLIYTSTTPIYSFANYVSYSKLGNHFETTSL